MFGICLPVDVLIFYKEPLGAFGTLFVTIWVLIPFLIMVADATFPEKEAVMVDKCRLNHVWIVLCSQYSASDGKVTKILKNSWTKHLSVTYNDKYNYGNYYQKIITFYG